VTDGQGELAVVIPVYGSRGHLQDIVDALGAQSVPVREVIISHSGDGNPTGQLYSERIAVRYLHQDQRLHSGAARNRGAALAGSDWLAFLDDDVIPARDWSQVVCETLSNDAGDTCCVGSLGVDVRGGYWGMSLWFFEFGSVHPYLPGREVQGGASANMFLHRTLFDRCGGFPERVARSVDVEFMARCRDAGFRSRFVPAARAGHRNIGGFEHCWNHALALGDGSARVRLKTEIRGSAATRYPLLSLLLPLPRILLPCYRVARWGSGYRLSFIYHLPGIVVMAVSWTRGFYLRASGRAGGAGAVSRCSPP
jgi:GT2 family glycosyltransferase